MNSTCDRFVAAARTYRGVRWHHLGRSRDGVDCIGLLLLAGRDAGLILPEPPPYARGHRGYDLARGLGALGREVSLLAARDGDVLLFADGTYPAHVGLRTTWADGRPAVLHAHARLRRVVEQPIAGPVDATLRAAYRPAQLED